MSPFTFDDEIGIEITVTHGSKVPGTYVGMAILDKWHQKFLQIPADLLAKQLLDSSNKLMAKIPARVLLAGVYYIDMALFVPRLTNFDYVSDACSFEIEDINSELSVYNGAEIGNVL